MYRFIPSVPAARKLIRRLVVVCAAVNATYLMNIPAFYNTREQEF